MEQNSRERGLRVRRREGMRDRCQIACRESKHVFLFVAMMHMPFAGAIIAFAFESFTINLFLNLPSFLTQVNLFPIQFWYFTTVSLGNSHHALGVLPWILEITLNSNLFLIRFNSLVSLSFHDLHALDFILHWVIVMNNTTWVKKIICPLSLISAYPATLSKGIWSVSRWKLRPKVFEYPFNISWHFPFNL